MPDWGEIFTDPGMQALKPSPEVMALLPGLKEAGCRRVLDAGCGVGRHLLPLADAGFQVWGVDREGSVLKLLQERLKGMAGRAAKALAVQADLRSLPFVGACFDLALSINVINHGDTRAFQEYCRELDRVLVPGGRLFIVVSPRKFGEQVLLPETRELEPGTWVEIATPDGALVHHFPTPAELRVRFPRYRLDRLETVRVPIPFMGGVKLPQLIFWGEKVQ